MRIYKIRVIKLSFCLILFGELIALAFLLTRINLNNYDTIDVFSINNKYYIYPKVDNLQYFYELKPGIGPIKDLTSIPGWLNYIPQYKINNDGLNENTEYSIKKPSNVFRIITLGDSFTFGLFVNTINSWPKKLESLLNNKKNCNNQKIEFEIVNLGLGGYDLQYETERYKLRGQKYNPDLVLWLVKDEDFQWMDELINPMVQKYSKLLAKKDYYNLSSKEWEKVWQKTSVEYNKKYSPAYINNLQTYNLQTISKYFNRKLVLLNLPLYSNKPEYQKIEERLVDERSDTFLHVLPDIIKLKAVFPETHPNEKGHQLIAQDLFNYLKDDKIIPCN